MNLIYPPSQKLLPFQVKAIEETIHFLQTNPANACYNACEMGLGKTVQAIVAAHTLLCNKILIVCPAVVRMCWEAEITAWGPPLLDYSSLDIVLSGKDANEIMEARSKLKHVLVTSYDLASSRPFLTWLESQKWDMLILDEGHFLKNGRAKRTRAVLGCIWPQAKYKLALSGTPFTTRVVDLYTIVRRMLPGQFPDFDSFADRFSYCRHKVINGRHIRDYYGVKDAETLSNLIRKNFYVRYRKDEVLSELPPKRFTKISLSIRYAVSPKGRDEKEKLEAEAEVIRRAIENDHSVPAVSGGLATHRRLQGEAKVEPICDFVQNLLDQDIPVVVFAWHKGVIAEIAKRFEACQPAVITGETPAGVRQTEIARFQSDKTTPLFIGSIGAASVGITLTRSTTVVFAELDWSPATVNQACDRCHRIGQKDSVNVYYFVCSNSLDCAITETVMSRAKMFKSILDGDSDAHSN